MFSNRQIISLLVIVSALAIATPILFCAGATIDLPEIGELKPPEIEEGNMAAIIRYIYIFGMAAVGLAAMGGLIYGGVLYLVAGGSVSKTSKAKTRIVASLSGLGLVLTAFIILYTINPALVNLTNPGTDPLQLIYSSFWTIASYGGAMADVPLNHPCQSDFDCRWDLACCPPGNTACTQNFKLPSDKTGNNLEAGSPPVEWYQCGNEKTPVWKYLFLDTAGGATCPDPWQDGGEACDESAKPEPRPGRTIKCCKPPRFVVANTGECECAEGKIVCNRDTDSEYKLCDECGPKISTCQKIKIDPNQKVKSRIAETERVVDDTYGNKCYYNYEWLWTQAFNIILKRETPRDSCLDYRLVCNMYHEICMEPGDQGTKCEYHSDCCQEYDSWTPHCRRYTDREISLECDSTEKICVLKKELEEKLKCKWKSIAPNTCADTTAAERDNSNGGADYLPTQVSSTDLCSGRPGPNDDACCCRPDDPKPENYQRPAQYQCQWSAEDCEQLAHVGDNAYYRENEYKWWCGSPETGKENCCCNYNLPQS